MYALAGKRYDSAEVAGLSEQAREECDNNPNCAYFSGGHAIVLFGWGETPQGVKYWWGRNSWGPEWGLQGLFKIRRGTNEVGIEENVVFAHARPKTPPCPAPVVVEALPSGATSCVTAEWDDARDTCVVTNSCSEHRSFKLSHNTDKAQCGFSYSGMAVSRNSNTEKAGLIGCCVTDDLPYKR